MYNVSIASDRQPVAHVSDPEQKGSSFAGCLNICPPSDCGVFISAASSCAGFLILLLFLSREEKVVFCDQRLRCMQVLFRFLYFSA